MEKISRQTREKLIERARQLRETPTHAEAFLWGKLRKKQVGGLKFRRQHIIHAYIVDFYCPQAKLVVEVDGSIHDEQEEYDHERRADLESLGFAVIRFRNEEITGEIEMVLAAIYDACMRRINKE